MFSGYHMGLCRCRFFFLFERLPIFMTVPYFLITITLYQIFQYKFFNPVLFSKLLFLLLTFCIALKFYNSLFSFHKKVARIMNRIVLHIQVSLQRFDIFTIESILIHECELFFHLFHLFTFTSIIISSSPYLISVSIKYFEFFCSLLCYCLLATLCTASGILVSG